jgi:hypothetical protein
VTDPDVVDAIFWEFDRIGMRKEDLPGLAIEGGMEREFLKRLEQFPAGASLHDVFPDMPSHWVAGQPETWTTPYRPFGPYDYQELPTGPAFHVQWPKLIDAGCLDRLMAAARQSGLPVYGVSFLTFPPDWPTLEAMIILERGTSEDRFDEFWAWLNAQPDVSLVAVPRLGDEEYV